MRPWFDDGEARALAEYIRGGGFVTEFRRTTELERRLAAELSVDERPDVEAADCAAPQRAANLPSGNVSDVIMTTSGTAALQLAFAAVGVREGTEVIVPDLTMVATANAARALGARVIFIDVDPELLTITASLVAPHLSNATRAVAFVALNNRATSLQLAELTALCRGRGVALVVDAAQSVGARVGGVALGAHGDIATLSFSSPKIISTGQGGAVVIPAHVPSTRNTQTLCAFSVDGDDATTNCDGDASCQRPMTATHMETTETRLADVNATDLAATVRILKNFGRTTSGADEYVEARGLNLKFTDLQAVVGLQQMDKLPWRVARMRDMWFRYRAGLEGVRGITMLGAVEDDPGWIPWCVALRAYLAVLTPRLRSFFVAVLLFSSSPASAPCLCALPLLLFVASRVTRPLSLLWLSGSLTRASMTGPRRAPISPRS